MTFDEIRFRGEGGNARSRHAATFTVFPRGFPLVTPIVIRMRDGGRCILADMALSLSLSLSSSSSGSGSTDLTFAEDRIDRECPQGLLEYTEGPFRGRIFRMILE